MRKTNKKGFTIVELVIVVAVIAILAAILIPTFAGIIKSANESVDMQIVAQMNKVLAADEIVNGKPATVVPAKEILIANGCDDFTPADANNVYYWVATENKVILWTKNVDNPETGKVTYPDDMAKKYSDVSTVSNDWSDLAVDYDVEILAPEEGQSLRSALLNTIQNADDGAILQLPKGETVDLGAGGLYFLGAYMKNDGGTARDITIDLNGGKIESLTTHSNGYYYGGVVPAGGTLTLVNGTVDVAGYVNGFDVESGSSLILRGVELNVPDGDAIFPAGDASEVILENCKITAGADYGIATNNQQSNRIYIKVSNTTIQAPSCAVLVNIPCDVHIDDSTIIGGGWGVLVRSGHAVINNSTIKTTDGDVGANDSRVNTSCEYFAYNASGFDVPFWGEGPQVPYAPLIVGDYAKHDSYNHDTDVALTNVKFENANAVAIPDVVVAARPEGKDVVVNYDNNTAVSRLVVFGEGYVRNEVKECATSLGINHTFDHKGTITVNGVQRSVTNSISSTTVYSTKNFDIRYTIPTGAGNFKKYTYYPVSKLDKEVDGVNIFEEFKQFYADQGFTLTDEEWATASFAPGSTANTAKTIIWNPAE